MNLTISLLLGTLFGTGLAISGMTDAAKVLNFLDLTGNWDASLAFVMGAGLCITVPSFYLIQRRQKPVLVGRFNLPTNNTIDLKLMLGSVIFGVGWGLYGYCPGPAISALVYFDWETALFVLSMAAGMYIAGKVNVGLTLVPVDSTE
ncbi:MAG: DUF6691 family protein [bacterium]|nr:YeeE/YedE family protein [Gammaproteobacteria bacterium]HIL97817.1 YeeE/YedE family protein [Pseudomonadales bacterium]